MNQLNYFSELKKNKKKNDIKYRSFGLRINKGVLVWISTLICVFAGKNPAYAEGGMFFHHHGESCFENVVVPCTEHFVYRETFAEQGECTFCNKTVPVSRFKTSEHCEYLNQWICTHVTLVCQECGNILSDQIFPTFIPHTKEERQQTCGKDDTTVVASVDFIQDPEASTSGAVVLKVVLNVIDSEFQTDLVQYSLDGGTTWGSDSTLCVTQNGSYSLAVKDAYETMYSKNFQVNNIVPLPLPQPPVETPEISDTRSIEESEISEPKPESVLKEQPIKEENLLKKEESNNMQESMERQYFHIPLTDGLGLENESKATFLEKEYIKTTNQQTVLPTVVEEQESMSEDKNPFIETAVVYRLAPAITKWIYIVAAILFLLAAFGMILFVMRHFVFLFEKDEDRKFFITCLIASQDRERHVYMDEKQMGKLISKELIMYCFYVKSHITFVLHTPNGKYRLKWERCMKVQI